MEALPPRRNVARMKSDEQWSIWLDIYTYPKQFRKQLLTLSYDETLLCSYSGIPRVTDVPR